MVQKEMVKASKQKYNVTISDHLLYKSLRLPDQYGSIKGVPSLAASCLVSLQWLGPLPSVNQAGYYSSTINPSSTITNPMGNPRC